MDLVWYIPSRPGGEVMGGCAITVLAALLLQSSCGGGGEEGDPAPESLVSCETSDYLSIAAADLLTHPDPRPFDPWTLWETGARLRGVDIFQRRTYPSYDDGWNGEDPVGPPYETADFEALRATGANVVDLSHPGLVDELAPYALCDQVQDALDLRLDQLAAADLFAIVSFRTGPGRNEFSIIGPDKWALARVWENQDDQDAWVDMWRYTARRYRNHPTVVAYDLMVEPNANAMLGPIWEPEPFYADHKGTLGDWNPLADRIIEAIREEDPDTPIIVGGDGFSGLIWLPYLEVADASRLVYSVHQYSPHDYTSKERASASCTGERYEGEPCTAAEFRTFLEPIATVTAAGVPVVVNEFGGVRYREGLMDYLDAQMTVFEELGVSHMAWEWGSEYELQLENDHWNIRHGTDEGHHAVAADNPLLDLYETYWTRNTDFPSTAE